MSENVKIPIDGADPHLVPALRAETHIQQDTDQILPGLFCKVTVEIPAVKAFPERIGLPGRQNDHIFQFIQYDAVDRQIGIGIDQFPVFPEDAIAEQIEGGIIVGHHHVEAAALQVVSVKLRVRDSPSV